MNLAEASKVALDFQKKMDQEFLEWIRSWGEVEQNMANKKDTEDLHHFLFGDSPDLLNEPWAFEQSMEETHVKLAKGVWWRKTDIESIYRYFGRTKEEAQADWWQSIGAIVFSCEISRSFTYGSKEEGRTRLSRKATQLPEMGVCA